MGVDVHHQHVAHALKDLCSLDQYQEDVST